ncbi:Uncharacterised protein [Mycobacteroides abscessus]|uniref:hypothetical protein n=1 Tax=Mycobacteroides abscessus TaxID=36809 RepID=UPI0005E21746|nr:hypothetical protein [Mycobacteroides abscessus]CPX20688.1 Uncharacterised protein [Mycobacteroides abscessus]CRG61245.1 Uncharacterised protein [Mycobacteroides abscessus]
MPSITITDINLKRLQRHLAAGLPDSEFTREQLAVHERQAQIVIADAMNQFRDIVREQVHERTDLMEERTEQELDNIAQKLVDELLHVGRLCD